MLQTMPGLPRFVCVGVVSIALIVFSVVSASDSCHVYTEDTLLRRLDHQFHQCLPINAQALDAFKEALITNEFDDTQRKPLAVVAIGSSPLVLDRFAVSVATAVVGEPPSFHAIRILDLAKAARFSRSAHEITQELRHEMATTLDACPEQRTLFVIRHVEQIQGEKLPLLDVFLDPLNGERATLHDARSGRDLDCRHALFVFLYQLKAEASVGSNWRDVLVQRWRQSATSHLATEAFTPQALAGRLTTAVVLTREEDKAHDNVCGLDTFLARIQAAQGTKSVLSFLSPPLLSSRQDAFVLSLVLLVIGVLLYPAKVFVSTSQDKAKVVGNLKATKHKRKASNKKPLPPPDTARLASLRSHSTLESSYVHVPAREETTDAATVTQSTTTPTKSKKSRTRKAKSSPMPTRQSQRHK